MYLDENFVELFTLPFSELILVELALDSVD